MKSEASFSVGGFLVGVGVGLGVALLFAPSSGADLRDNIATKSHELGDSARQGVESLRKGFRRGVEHGSATGTDYR